MVSLRVDPATHVQRLHHGLIKGYPQLYIHVVICSHFVHTVILSSSLEVGLDRRFSSVGQDPGD